MSPFIPERIFKPVCDSRLNRICLKTKHPARPRSFAALCQLLTPSCSKKITCQYSFLSSNRAPLLTSFPPLCAVLTFKGLVWPRAPQCHALGPEMPSLSFVLPLTLSLPLSLAWLGQHNHVSRAVPGQKKMDYVSSLSMAMLTLAKRGQQKLGRFGRYHFANLGKKSQHLMHLDRVQRQRSQ